MNARNSIDLGQFPDSPYAAELRSGVGRLRFADALEKSFVASHLEEVHLRVRIWAAMGQFFALTFTALYVLNLGVSHPVALLHLLLVLPVCSTLSLLPFSRFYRTHYLPVARFLGPLACLITATFSGMGVAEGRYEVLIIAALQMVGVFHFTGLLFRVAVATCIASLLGFALGLNLWGLDAAIAGKYVATLAMAAVVAAIAFRNTEMLARKQFLEANLLAELLERDPLTGLKNRRAFDEHLRRVWLQAQRDKRSIVLLMIDVDDFKSYNDIYGHQAGDEALRRVGQALRDSGRRPFDLVARYGGEEFAVILHDCAPRCVSELTEAVRRSVETLAIAHRGARAAQVVTLSIGAAIVEPKLGRSTEGLVQLADEALYEAKTAGRNRVIVKGADAYESLETGTFHRPRAVTG